MENNNLYVRHILNSVNIITYSSFEQILHNFLIGKNIKTPLDTRQGYNFELDGLGYQNYHNKQVWLHRFLYESLPSGVL